MILFSKTFSILLKGGMVTVSFVVVCVWKPVYRCLAWKILEEHNSTTLNNVGVFDIKLPHVLVWHCFHKSIFLLNVGCVHAYVNLRI